MALSLYLRDDDKWRGTFDASVSEEASPANRRSRSDKAASQNSIKRKSVDPSIRDSSAVTRLVHVQFVQIAVSLTALDRAKSQSK
jgi:hypothetical protein